MPKAALRACCCVRQHGSPPACLTSLLDVWTSPIAIASTRPGYSISFRRPFHKGQHNPFESRPSDAGRRTPKPQELSERISLLVNALKKLQGREQNPAPRY